MAASPPAGSEIGVARLAERLVARHDLRRRAPTPTDPLVLVSPLTSLAWELWPEPRTVALSTRFSIVRQAELLRAAIVVDRPKEAGDGQDR
jgi:hypothetical protein